MIYLAQIANSFTGSYLLSGLITTASETKKRKKKKLKGSLKPSSTTKVQSVPKKIRPREFEETVEYDDDDEDEESFFVEEDADDSTIEFVSTLEELLGIMNILDDGLEATSKEDEEAMPMYDEFGKYYLTIVPYIDRVNLSYQQNMVSELELDVDRLNKLVTKMVTKFFVEYDLDDNSVNLGNRLTELMKQILEMSKARIEAGSGRPSFDSVMSPETKGE